MVIDESREARVDPRGRGIDPLARQAANLLAEAMVMSHDRDALLKRFHSLVVDEVTELEEAPIREALEAMEHQGIRLEAVARVVNDRLGG